MHNTVSIEIATYRCIRTGSIRIRIAIEVSEVIVLTTLEGTASVVIRSLSIEVCSVCVDTTWNFESVAYTIAISIGEAIAFAVITCISISA